MPDSLDLTRRETRLGTQRREVSLAPSSYNADARSVELNAATGFRVKRWGWDGAYLEQLQISDKAIDWTRVDKGQCPLLDTHARWSVDDQLGMVTGARVEKSTLVLTTQFAASDRGAEIEARVAAGDLKGVSVGYRVLEMALVGKEGDLPIFEVTRWELLEVSLVPVPADPDSGVRSAQEDLYPCIIHDERKVSAMPDTNNPPAASADTEAARAAAVAAAAPAAPAAPAATAQEARMSTDEALDFVDQARGLGVDDKQARTWATSMTPDKARAELLKAAATRQNGDAPQMANGQAARIGRDERDTRREGLTEALSHRMSATNVLTDKGRNFRGLSLRELVRDCLVADGVRGARNMTPRELFREVNISGRAQSSSDFGYALSNSTSKTLRAAYESAGQTFRIWQRKALASDFKNIERIQLSGAPTLFEVPEGGEYQMGVLSDAREIYQLAKYGRKLGFTFEMFINDDLGAFERITTMMGRAAGNFESDVCYAPLLANPTMGDGTALFHANHGNLAGVGADPSESTLANAELAMGSQKTIEGTPMNITGKYFITGRKYAVPARKLFAQTTAANTSDVNAFAGMMTPVIESRLNGGAGATPWFVAADYNEIDTLEYCYLEGEEGVFLDEREGFDVDQFEYKVRLIIASKAIDFRGLYKNPGQ